MNTLSDFQKEVALYILNNNMNWPGVYVDQDKYPELYYFMVQQGCEYLENTTSKSKPCLKVVK